MIWPLTAGGHTEMSTLAEGVLSTGVIISAGVISSYQGFKCLILTNRKKIVNYFNTTLQNVYMYKYKYE